MKKGFLFQIFAFVALASLFLFINGATAQTVTISPAGSNIGKNTNFSLTLNIGSVTNLFGMAFDLNFDPNLIDYVSSTEGNFLSQGCQTSLMTAENPAGKLIFGLTRLGASCNGVSGSGTVATLNFGSLNQDGTANLIFSNNSLCILSGSNCTYIVGTWNGSTITISASVTYITNLNFTLSLEGATVAGKTFTITIYQGATQVAQFTAQPNAQNQIPLPAGVNLASGTYNITTDAPYYLRVRQNNVSLASNLTVALSILKAGDLNNDSTINSLDWSQMNSQWYTNSYPSDINQDGVVNSIDFSWLNKNWLLADA